MPSTFEKLSPTRAKYTIEIPFTDLEPAIKKAYKEIADQVTIPGFRKGKVPAAIIDQRVGRGVVLQEALDAVLPDAYNAAIVESKLVPLGQPDIEVTKLEDHEVVEVSAEVDVRPDFDLPDFSAVKAEVKAVEATDKDIDERIDMLRERFATTSEVKRGAKKGDQLVINLVGRRDGEVLEDASAEGITYKVGATGMIDGLDEAVIGLKAGESKEFATKLVGGAERGKEADVEVTVVSVSKVELPKVDDEFAQLVSEFDTVDEMRADLAEGLALQNKYTQRADARDKVLEEVLKLVEFELPEALLNSDLEARKAQVRAQLAQAGLTVEQYLEEAEDETAKTAEEFWADIEKRGTDALRAQIVLDKYAEEQEVQVSQQDLTELLFRKAQTNGTTPEQEAAHMVEHNHMAEWMGEIRRGKALEAIVKAATIVDTAGNAVAMEDAPAEEPSEESTEA